MRIKKGLNSKEFKEEIREGYEYQELRQKLAKKDVDAYITAMDEEFLFEILTYLCKGNLTGDLRTDIVMGAFYANIEAHNGDYRFYDIKSMLLEYIFENELWGIEPYDCFGIGEDSYGNEVAYFDVPNCGQVSFHLVNTYYDMEKVPFYDLEWCGTINKEFPSYKSIKNFHNLLIALGYDNYGSLEDAIIAVNPINFFKITNDEEKVAYYAGLKEFYQEEYNYSSKGVPYDNNLLKSIMLKKVVFSEKDGIISEEYIENLDLKTQILKKYPCFDSRVYDVLKDIGIIEVEFWRF